MFQRFKPLLFYCHYSMTLLHMKTTQMNDIVTMTRVFREKNHLHSTKDLLKKILNILHIVCVYQIKSTAAWTNSGQHIKSTQKTSVREVFFQTFRSRNIAEHIVNFTNKTLCRLSISKETSSGYTVLQKTGFSTGPVYMRCSLATWTRPATRIHGACTPHSLSPYD